MAYATEEKKRQAYSMHVRGITDQEIANIMRRSVSTVRSWIKSCSEDVKDRLKTINQEDYVGIMLSRFQALREEAWANYHSAQKKTDRGRFWKAILELEKTEVATLVKMGYVKAVAEQVEHTHEHTVTGTAFMQSEFNIARLDAFSVDLLADRLGEDAKTIMGMIPKSRNFHSLPESAKKHLSDDIIDHQPVSTEPQPVTLEQLDTNLPQSINSQEDNEDG